MANLQNSGKVKKTLRFQRCRFTPQLKIYYLFSSSNPDAVEALIAAIADKEPGTAGAELEDLAALTGKVHTDVEFAEYWSWTDLDTLARLTLTPEPPCIPDLSREELVELVEIIQHCSVTGREWAMRYYTALLRRSLSLPNVMDFVASGEDVEVIAEKLLQAAR